MSVDEHTIELAGSPVFFRHATGPGDPVLYLHGIPTSSDDWVPFLERAGGLAPDLPGFGRSGKGGHLDYTVEGQAQFIETLLDELGVERIKLVVHDCGAAGGLLFAQRNPSRVQRLVVCNAIPLWPPFNWPTFVRLWRRAAVGELLMGSITRGLLARTMRKGGPWPRARIEQVWSQFDQGTQRAILRLCRDATDHRLAALGSGLTTLGLPVLVIWGQRDPWLAPEVGRTYAEGLPRARLERVSEGGHWPWLEEPGVIDLVADFLHGTEAHETGTEPVR